MNKTFADLCLERANRATPGPWKIGVTYHHEKNAEFIAAARTDVPELAARLHYVCDELRAIAGALSRNMPVHPNYLNDLVAELEALPE